jgi:hypothetical protein
MAVHRFRVSQSVLPSDWGADALAPSAQIHTLQVPCLVLYIPPTSQKFGVLLADAWIGDQDEYAKLQEDPVCSADAVQ